MHLMDNYDQTVPKLHVNLNIFFKKHFTLTQSGVERRLSWSPIAWLERQKNGQKFVHISSLIYSLYGSPQDSPLNLIFGTNLIFSSIWGSIMIKLYLNVMLSSIFGWKIITFWHKLGLKEDFGGVQLNDKREKNLFYMYFVKIHHSTSFLIQIRFLKSIWGSIMIKLYLNFMLTSMLWWKMITFWHKVGLEGYFGRVHLNG